MTKVSVKEFFEMCQTHDWFYQFSDDHRVWSLGSAGNNKLLELTKSSPVFEKIYSDWKEYHFSGPAWGTKKPSMPILENYI